MGTWAFCEADAQVDELSKLEKVCLLVAKLSWLGVKKKVFLSGMQVSGHYSQEVVYP